VCRRRWERSGAEGDLVFSGNKLVEVVVVVAFELVVVVEIKVVWGRWQREGVTVLVLVAGE